MKVNYHVKTGNKKQKQINMMLLSMKYSILMRSTINTNCYSSRTLSNHQTKNHNSILINPVNANKGDEVEKKEAKEDQLAIINRNLYLPHNKS